ncbi:hypothetical protein BBO_01709 [Beauveria brongniartii RCEF 3172]|uniref:Uncharacterized protein n=1 Tax=Beauveria brongniartii RCEF 3172 TaxID=1081107 RepID=A0A162KES9_9HYPO|nr:hypothetical protein BBO_01709 [Beauveria brongniartii RCEF 3172]
MKTPIILATLFAGSLAAVLPSGLDITPADCAIAEIAIEGGVKFTWPMVPNCRHKEEAYEVGVAAFEHGIKCGPAPAEPEAPPAGERCSKVECAKLEKAIEKGKEYLRHLQIDKFPGYPEGEKEGIRCFKKKIGCEEKAEVTV